MTVPTVLVSIARPRSGRWSTSTGKDVLPAVENGVATVLMKVVAMVAGLLGALMLTRVRWALAARH